jgi:hypothetical protein
MGHSQVFQDKGYTASTAELFSAVPVVDTEIMLRPVLLLWLLGSHRSHHSLESVFWCSGAELVLRQQSCG